MKSNLERRLRDYGGKPVGVVVRTASEMQAILRANPFPKAAPNHTYTIFLDEPPPHDALKHATGAKDEQCNRCARDNVHYDSGMGRSN